MDIAQLSNKMAKKEGKEKKSVEGILKDVFKSGKKDDKEPVSERFKDVFKPKKGEEGVEIEISEEEKVKVEVTDKEPVSEIFKDVFKPKKGEEGVEIEISEEEKQMEMSIIDILKDARKKGLIDSKKYDQAIQKIVKRSVKGKRGLIGEIEFIEGSSGPEIILEEGEIGILPGSRVEVVKKNGEISIMVKRGGKRKTTETYTGALEKLIEGEVKGGTKESIGEIDKSLDKLDQMDWLEGYKEEGSIVGEVKDELELTDLRREFKEEKKVGGIVEEEMEEKKMPGILDRVMKVVKKTTEESRSEKLKRLALENLNRIRDIENEEKAIIGIAYVLKEFLEVKFEIPHELTYLELITELRERKMDPELRNRLITFFKRTAIMVYANAPKMDTVSRTYSLAERTIKELS